MFYLVCFVVCVKFSFWYELMFVFVGNFIRLGAAQGILLPKSVQPSRLIGGLGRPRILSIKVSTFTSWSVILLLWRQF